MLLIASDDDAEVIALIGGVPDAEGSELLRRRAARIGAVAAAFTTESWLGALAIPRAGFEHLDPEDLPRASEMPDRLEAVTTTAVWPDGQAVRHCITVITRTPHGSTLADASWFAARDYGTSRWLESLLP